MKYVVKLIKEIERTVVVEASSDEEADKLLLEGKYDYSTERTTTDNVYLGYDYISYKTSDIVITSEQDLKDYYSTDDIGRMLFKYTDCGCCYLAKEEYVSVTGYAEGSGDAECQEHRLYFPFTIEEWNDAIEEADREGCELWEECNNENDVFLNGNVLDR